MELLGRRIAECRKEKHFTQDELAARLGVTPQALSKWERSQSLPDILLLKELCGILEVSADYLLGIERDKIVETGDERIQDEIWKSLRNASEPLELLFGEGLTPAFLEQPYMELIMEVRRRLAADGILLPIVRLRDMPASETGKYKIAADEYQVVSYGKVLFSESLKETGEDTCAYIIEQLGEVVRNRYADILEPDLVKKLIDNLQIKYPALIQGIVPERISYGLLTEVLKNYVAKGHSMADLPKVLEHMECVLRSRPEATVEELVSAMLF